MAMKTSHKIGVMEWWSIGMMGSEFVLTNISLLQYSITPTIALVSDILCEPFKRQRVAETFRLRQAVSGSAHSREL
jgi:hypothetical protein